ncbi:hypothetical protein L4C54_19200 [Vibrio lamellibrachiae]|uniref:hypothetical protein n=1 Tax=Vibrio lamellibrachiae TaxID=2910253 RepID=UPI003D107F31
MTLLTKGLFGALLFATSVAAETITLTLPSYSDESHIYYHELLYQALTDAGHEVQITTTSVHIPQKRAIHKVKTGEFSLIWLVESKQRNEDKDYIPVSVGLTDSLIGQRVLFVPKGDEDVFRFVDSLEDFRTLGKVGGFGQSWFDTKVWALNGLPYLEIDGEWRRLYKMLARRNRGLDYFSRGLTEIANESIQHPYLSIDPYLLLSYERDFVFYISSKHADIVPVLKEALIAAEKNGLIKAMAREYWSADFEFLNVERRKVIKLKTPN